MIGYEIVVDFFKVGDPSLLLKNCLTNHISRYEVFLEHHNPSDHCDYIVWEFSDGSAVTVGLSFNRFRYTETIDCAFDAIEDEHQFDDLDVSLD